MAAHHSPSPSLGRVFHPFITLDIDWVPDWIIDFVAGILLNAGVKATWFVTHDSPATRRLADHPQIFYLGIHPNCLPGSSHGDSEDDVLAHCKTILPDAVAMRTHSLYQSSRFLIKAARDHGIKIDVSLFLPGEQQVSTHKFCYAGIELLRAPFVWEDDFAVFEEGATWSVDSLPISGKGISILNFHPVHLALNTVDFGVYESLKQKRPMTEWTEEFVAPFVNTGSGPLTLFRELVARLSLQGSATINELL